MASTNVVNGVTVSDAGWAQDVNDRVYVDVINVKNDPFNAVGNGVADDTVAIQAACDAVDAAGGGMMFFPKGDYLISSPIDISANTTVRGVGYGSRIICPDAGWDTSGPTSNKGMLSIIGESKCRITGVRIYGTKSQDANHSPKLIYFETVDGLTIDHCWLFNTAWEGIWQGGTQANNRGIIIESNHIEDVGEPAGAFVGLPAIQFNAEEAVIANNRLFNVGTGIGASGARITISGNFIKGITNAGIGTGDSSEAGVITISGNTIEFTAHATEARTGVLLADGSGSRRIVNVTGNTVRVVGNASYDTSHCYRQTSGENVSIVGNTAEIDIRGRGFRFVGTTAGTKAHICSNTVRVTNESGVSIGFSGTSSGGTLIARLSDNHVYGVTRAQSSYAFDFTAFGGGTLDCIHQGDIGEEGFFRVDAYQYQGGSFSVDGVPVYDRTDQTKVTEFMRHPQAGMLNIEPTIAGDNYTIAAGVLTITGTTASQNKLRSRIVVNTEANAATDDLDTITGGSDGDIIIISPSNDARTVVVKNNTGNIQCGSDFSMDNLKDRMMLHREGSVWYQLSRSDNGA